MSKILLLVNSTPEYNSDRTLDGSSDEREEMFEGGLRSDSGTDLNAIDRMSREEVKSRASFVMAKSPAEAFSSVERLWRF